MCFMNIIVEGNNLALMNSMSNGVVKDDSEWGTLTLDILYLSYYVQTIIL